jgi:hypothetical protein
MMPRSALLVVLGLGLAALAPAASAAPLPAAAAARLRFSVRYPASLASGPLDGRLLLLLSTDASAEPRFQIRDTDVAKSQQVFGIDVDGWRPGAPAVIDASVLGYPAESLAAVKPGRYRVQALLHRYETFHRADGHVVKLPMDRGEGQQWNRAPGNLLSAPREVEVDPAREQAIEVVLDQAIPEIPPPADTTYVKHIRIQSERLTKFWGRPMHLGAVVLLPWGFDAHPEARYPLAVFHGHFPHTASGFREAPPDAQLPCEYSERFRLDCYNRIEQEQAHQLYLDWTSPGFPRFLVVEIQHANPYYDDSYAVNSENLGPYGDAIQYELIPEIERRFRGIGQGWARFTYGGSTGGWEALAVQVKYPDEWNGCWAACPDPIDFRAYLTTNVYEDRNAYWQEGPFGRVARPGHRDWLGHVSATIQDSNRAELVLGTKSRSGGQFDVWEAVYAPVGPDGYPRRIWDKASGVIDREVALRLRESYDLSYILRRDWSKGLGQKLAGKIHIYCGDMDNYYLNDAVYLAEDFLKATADPPYGGEVDYGDRAEHCWNGDHTRPNAISRLRYIQMHAPKMLERIEASAPPGADTKSWRY